MNDDTDFQIPPSPRQEPFASFASPSAAAAVGDFRTAKDHQNPRKKRSKMMKIETPVVMTSSSGISKPKYGKKPDPGAPKITRPCSECGKKFWSWKALFGHMRCHPERQWRGINPPPNFQQPISPVKPLHDLEGVMTEEDHEVATCLLMLANGPSAFETPCGTSNQGRLLEFDTFVRDAGMGGDAEGAGPSGSNCRFECSSCKKVFGSHQALGGHRASHKNVKGCFAITRNDGEDEDPNGGGQGEDGEGTGEAKENMEDEKMVMVLGHKCSICLRVFSSGQALGGHKRCHWEKGEDPSVAQGPNPFATKEGCGLDLNLPAPLEDGSASSYSYWSDFGFKVGNLR
ncbi:hypothetical protein L1049_015104 [Liquidambar formosana]|uniref:C2H2-type domain-containing protein n=1 Tax=Liquidambar formosana TaxID=63359 RepID=A0AAP0RXE6_LIQFO